jgi:hypothetical protein
MHTLHLKERIRIESFEQETKVFSKKRARLL